MTTETPKPFYCWIEKGEKIVTDQEPEGFHELPNRQVFIAVNQSVAEMTYSANLRILDWQSIN